MYYGNPYMAHVCYRQPSSFSQPSRQKINIMNNPFEEIPFETMKPGVALNEAPTYSPFDGSVAVLNPFLPKNGGINVLNRDGLKFIVPFSFDWRSEEIPSVAFNPADGSLVAGGGRRLRAWDKDGSVIFESPVAIKKLAYTGDGFLVAITTPRPFQGFTEVKVWDQEFNEIQTLSNFRDLRWVEIAPDGALVVASYTAGIFIYKRQGISPVKRPTPGHYQ